MSAISGVNQSAEMARLLTLLLAGNPRSADAATQQVLATLEANQAKLQEALASLGSGTSIDVIA